MTIFRPNIYTKGLFGITYVSQLFEASSCFTKLRIEHWAQDADSTSPSHAAPPHLPIQAGTVLNFKIGP